jgi:DNA mismatch repair protein MutL
LLGPPERARSGTQHLALYVNGRHVRDRLLLRAVAQSYGSTLEGGRYPVGAVLVDVPPEEVDVNVHPQKSEVRFASQGSVFEAVMVVLRDAANGAPWAQAAVRPRDFWDEKLSAGPAVAPVVPETVSVESSPVTDFWSQLSQGPTLENKAPALIARARDPESTSAPSPLHAFVEPTPSPEDPWARLVQAPYPPKSYENVSSPPVVAPVAAVPHTTPPSELPGGGSFGALRYVGQLRRMYLLCEGDAGVVILDQHAAAERVTFERLRKAFGARQVSMQPMLVAERVEMSPEDVSLVEERSEELLSLGMDLSPVGPTTVAVRAVPSLLLRADPRRLARDLVAEMSRQGNDFSRAVDLVLATMACHGSVRGGDVLADEEARALLLSLDNVSFAGHCPHGRPVVWSVRWNELERKVGR